MNDNGYIILNFDLQTRKIRIKSNKKLKFDKTYMIEVKAITINNNENMTD